MIEINSGDRRYTVTITATRARVRVLLVCSKERAFDQTWSYVHDVEHSKLVLCSVAKPDSTEIERDPKLRAAVRRLAVAAWGRTSHDIPSMC